MSCLTILLSLVGFASAVKLTDPVNTPIGQIRGKFAADGTYSKFLGIPYAQVDPKKPFGISIPHPGFNRIFDAINDTIIMCPQPFGGISSLDCLNLNLYVPHNGEIKAILVWIYGGAFRNGYARLYDDERFLVRKNVIFVSFNYRVGPYGFMCLDTEDVPGNQGLRDQYLALKWVKDNIAAFGGDANRITVIGESAGAMSIDLHLLSELPKFFNGAILHSGSANIPSTVTPSNKTVPMSMAKQLGFNTNNITEALSFLAGVPTKLVIATYKRLNISPTPCVEMKFPNIERFISSYPDLNSNSVQLNNISIMGGFSNQEGIFHQTLYERNIAPHKSPKEMLQSCINMQFDTSEMRSMVDKVKRFYVGDKEVNQAGDLLDFFSDFFFVLPVQRSLIRYVEAGAQVYQYLFSYDGNRNYMKKRLNIETKGASHGDDLGYLFDIPFFSEQPTVADQLIIDRINEMWTNFVKCGNPTPATSELLPVTWPRVTRDVLWYLNIDTNLTVGTRPFNKRMLFWDLFLIANKDKLWANVYQTTSSPQNVS